jgi:phosphoserine aminotransferase
MLWVIPHLHNQKFAQISTTVMEASLHLHIPRIVQDASQTPVPEFARKAMSDITIHHRTKEFEAIFERTRNLLIEIYNMPEVLMLASSGTGSIALFQRH